MTRKRNANKVGRKGDFPETIEKQVLRRRGYQHLKELAETKQRKLGYLGLSGIRARDVIEWADQLEAVTIIERPTNDDADREIFRREVFLRLLPTFGADLRVHFADIWCYLAAELPKADRAPDIVNLDFCGGLLYEEAAYPKQRRGFQKLFEHGSKHSNDFIVMITLMPRDRGHSQYLDVLQQHLTLVRPLLKGIDSKVANKQLAATKEFYAKNNLYLMKVCLELLLADIGRQYNYQVHLSYHRLYARMLHLAFACTFMSNKFAMTPQPGTIVDILNSPLQKLLSDGKLQIQRPPLIKVKLI